MESTNEKQIQEVTNHNVLHIITVSFVINHFFGNQFNYLQKKTGNNYFLGCSASEEFLNLSESLNYKTFPVEVTRSINPLEDLKAIFKIYRFIKREKIVKVIGHTPKGGMVAMIASYIAGVKERIYFRHGIIYETSTGIKRLLLKNIDRFSGSLATKVVCVSNSVKEISIKDNLNNPKKNIVLGIGTCNGIDTEEKYNPNTYDEVKRLNLKQSLNIKEDDIVIGYVGRLVKDKGINELIVAWNILEKKYHNIKLLLVGPIESRDSISETSKKEININSNIINTGFVLHSSPYFSIMDIFILPTYREGFPTVSLEASSMEVPVIISKATGCEESIIENQTGMFIKNDPNDIATKIEKYIRNENLRKQHGKAGRIFVQNNFEQTKIWDLIIKKLNY